MTESFISLCCANSYWTNAGCYVSNTAITLSQAQTDKASTRHDGPLCWLVLGKQPQWGKSTSTGEYVTHTFPIKFTVIPIVVAGALTSNTSGNTGSQSNPCYRSITVSNFVFCMYDNARGYAGSTYIAIGYQLQWGYSGYAVNFPISFDIVYNVLSIPQNTASTSNSYWGRFYITNLTKNGFTVSDTGAGSNRWLAIGKAQPQWGYYVESQSETDYRYWPISFIFHYVTMATKTYYEPKEEAVPWLVGIDMQKFICGYGANFIGSNYVSCVAIGCQLQWGVGAASTNIMLPIPYTKVKFITLATSSMLNPSQGNISVAYHDSTLDNIRFQIRWQGLAAEYTGAWLTLGI